MGYYINPPNMPKEQWIMRYGVKITDVEFRTWRFGEGNKEWVPCCLVDNGVFHALGVAYSKEEARIFGNTKDARPNAYFRVRMTQIRKDRAMPPEDITYLEKVL